MIWIFGLAVAAIVYSLIARSTLRTAPADLSILPEQFVVFDLETTGLRAAQHEIIEIGAIRVNRDAEEHQTFQTLIRPNNRVPKAITELTGITNAMVQSEGMELAIALAEFQKFVGGLPLVSFNAKFDDAFLREACAATSSNHFANESCCALELARRAWPSRTSFRLSDIARDGNLPMEDTHRALGDCRRTMIVFIAAARELGTYR